MEPPGYAQGVSLPRLQCGFEFDICRLSWTAALRFSSYYSKKVFGYDAPYGVYFRNIFKGDGIPSTWHFVGDTANKVLNGKAQGTGYYYTYDKGSGEWGYLHMRHKNKINLWFADGHAGGVMPIDLKPVYNLSS